MQGGLGFVILIDAISARHGDGGAARGLSLLGRASLELSLELRGALHREQLQVAIGKLHC